VPANRFGRRLSLGVRQGRNATAIRQDLVFESGIVGGHQTIARPYAF
jgi:hypothetical protein